MIKKILFRNTFILSLLLILFSCNCEHEDDSMNNLGFQFIDVSATGIILSNENESMNIRGEIPPEGAIFTLKGDGAYAEDFRLTKFQIEYGEKRQNIYIDREFTPINIDDKFIFGDWGYARYLTDKKPYEIEFSISPLHLYKSRIIHLRFGYPTTMRIVTLIQKTSEIDI